MDRAVQLYAMKQKKKVDAGWIILNMIDSVKPSKALWFAAIITQLCTNARVEVEKNEERITTGLAFLARALDEAPHISGRGLLLR